MAATLRQAFMCLLMLGGLPSVESTLNVWQQEAIDARECHDTTSAMTSPTTPINTRHPYFNCFRPHDEIEAFLDRLLAVNQTNRRLSKVRIAISVQRTPPFDPPPHFSLVVERPIFGYNWMAKTPAAPSPARPMLYIQAGIHPREWASISSIVYAMAMAPFDVTFVPVVNVDGYRLTWADPMHRLSRKNLRGVDLNRNFGPVELFTTSTDKASETYSGPYAMSEPETQGIATYLRSVQSLLRGALDIHTTAGVVVRPLSVSNEPLPGNDEAMLYTLGDAVANAMNTAARGASGGVPYSSIAGHELYQGALYSGTFKDMVYLSLNRTPSLTIELRGTNGFLAPSGSIRSSGEELVAAIDAFARQLHG